MPDSACYVLTDQQTTRILFVQKPTPNIVQGTKKKQSNK